MREDVLSDVSLSVVRHTSLDNKHGRSVKAIHSFLSRWRGWHGALCRRTQEEPCGKKSSMGSEGCVHWRKQQKRAPERGRHPVRRGLGSLRRPSLPPRVRVQTPTCTSPGPLPLGPGCEAPALSGTRHCKECFFELEVIIKWIAQFPNAKDAF